MTALLALGGAQPGRCSPHRTHPAQPVHMQKRGRVPTKPGAEDEVSPAAAATARTSSGVAVAALRGALFRLPCPGSPSPALLQQTEGAGSTTSAELQEPLHQQHLPLGPRTLVPSLLPSFPSRPRSKAVFSSQGQDFFLAAHSQTLTPSRPVSPPGTWCTATAPRALLPVVCG